MASICMHNSSILRCAPAQPTVKFLTTSETRRLSIHRLRLRQDIRSAAEKRESTIFGDLINEEEQIQDIPPPGEKDFWEGEKWEWLGKLSFVLVPALIFLAVIVGAFAAKTYDSGASSYLAPASSEEETVKLIPGQNK